MIRIGQIENGRKTGFKMDQLVCALQKSQVELGLISRPNRPQDTSETLASNCRALVIQNRAVNIKKHF